MGVTYNPGSFDFLNAAKQTAMNQQIVPDFLGSNSPTNSNGWLGISGFGANMDTAKLGLGVMGGLSNIWASMQAQDLAKKQFDFTKTIGNTNLDNSIKSYNTGLEDRARSRGVAEGQTAAQTQDYIDRNRMMRG